MVHLLKLTSCCLRFMQKGRKDVRGLTGVSIFMAIKCTAELDIMTHTHTHTHPANSIFYTTFTTTWHQEIPYYLFSGLKDMKKNLTVFFYCFIPHLCYMVAGETLFVHVNKHDK